MLALPLLHPALNSPSCCSCFKATPGEDRCVPWSISSTQAERALLAARCLPAVVQSGSAWEGTLRYCARGLGMTEFFLALSHSSESSSVQDADHCPVTESPQGILKLAASSQHQGKEMNTSLQLSKEECKAPATQLHCSGCWSLCHAGEGDRWDSDTQMLRASTKRKKPSSPYFFCTCYSVLDCRSGQNLVKCVNQIKHSLKSLFCGNHRLFHPSRSENYSNYCFPQAIPIQFVIIFIIKHLYKHYNIS